MVQAPRSGLRFNLLYWVLRNNMLHSTIPFQAESPASGTPRNAGSMHQMNAESLSGDSAKNRG